MIKKFAHTFFFGYLATKWKRLLRVLTIMSFFILTVLFSNNEVIVFMGERFGVLFFFVTILLPIYIIVTSVISWVIKPFMVNK